MVYGEKFEFRGGHYTISELSRMPECEVTYSTLYRRLTTSGWIVEQAIKDAPRSYSKRSRSKSPKLDRELIKKIMSKPIKPTASYEYWVKLARTGGNSNEI